MNCQFVTIWMPSLWVVLSSWYSLAPSRTGGQTASLFVDAKLAAERSDVVLSADQANGAAVKVGYCTKDFPKLEMSADPSLFTGSGWGGTSAGQEILVGRPVLYGQLAFVTYWARAASPVQARAGKTNGSSPHLFCNWACQVGDTINPIVLRLD